MKTNFTLRSIFAALALCFVWIANAQTVGIDVQAPTSGYAGDVVELQLSAWKNGMNWDTFQEEALPSNILITFNDVEGYTFSQKTLNATEITNSTPITLTLTLPELTAEEKAIGYKEFTPNITWTVENQGGYTVKIDNYPIEVYAAEPSLTVGLGMTDDALYKSLSYSYTAWVKGNPFVTKDATIVLSGDGATFADGTTTKTVSASEIAAAKTNDYVVELPITIVPTTLAEASTYTLSLTSDEDTDIASHTLVVYDNVASISFNEVIIEKATIGEEQEAWITLTYSPFITSDITLEAITEGVTFSKTTLTTTKEGTAPLKARFYAYYTPTTVSDEPTYFEFKATADEVSAIGKVTITKVVGQIPAFESVSGGNTWDSFEALQSFQPNNGFNITLNQYFAAQGGTIKLSCTSHPNEVNFGTDAEIPVSKFEESWSGGYFYSTEKPTITPSNPTEAEEERVYTFQLEHVGGIMNAEPFTFTKTYTIIRVGDGTTTAVEHAAVEVEATKIIENGRLIIVKDGVRYDVLGNIVK